MQPVCRALIFCQPEIGAIEVAAPALLDRLVVACHRAGCSEIQIVCAGALPSLKRANALSIPTEIKNAAPALFEPTLVAECRLIAQVADVQAVVAKPGRLLDM